MKKLLLSLLVLLTSACSGAIPHPVNYEWGKLKVPENYALPNGQKLEIYWEKLKASAPAAEAIVLINGGPGMTHDSFHQKTANGYNKDYFEELRTHFDVYYFDQRGTGNSSPITWANFSGRNYRVYASPDISRDIEELRKNVIKKKKIAVLGESYGGMVALSYAVMFPDSVSRLVIHDSSPSNAYFNKMHVNFSEGLTRLEELLPGVEENMKTCVTKFDAGEVTNSAGIDVSSADFLTLCLPYTYSLRGQIIMGLMAGQIAIEGRSDILDAILGAAAKIASRAVYSQLDVTLLLVQTTEMLNMSDVYNSGDSDPWSQAWAIERIFQHRVDFRKDHYLSDFAAYNVISRLGKITAPTLVVVGETDFICPPAYAEIMHEGIGDCRLLKVKNAAHGGFVEQHEYVVGKIRNFLLGRYPGDDERIIPVEELQTRDVEDAVDVWLEGVARLGLTTSFLKTH